MISAFAPPPPQPPTARNVALILVLVLGLFIAIIQTRRIAPVSGSGLVTGWSGVWMFFSLITFALLALFFRRKRPSLAPIASAVLFSVGLNACVYSSAEDRLRSSEATIKAAPFFEAFQRGESPTDEEIKAAHVGEYEPMLLTQVATRRELEGLLSAYDATWSKLDVSKMLWPDQLASPAARASSRADLAACAGIHDAFRRDLKVAFDAFLQSMERVADATPSMKGLTASKLEEKVGPTRDYYLAVAASTNVPRTVCGRSTPIRRSLRTRSTRPFASSATAAEAI